ncbi:MAG: hypothetical protein WCH75_30140, partial [Candidatus Binatia bacterium]
MTCVRSLSWGLLHVISVGFLISTQPEIALAQANPCAAKATKANPNPCAAQNPCSAKNPCAGNPCAPGGKAGAAAGKAVTVRGEVAKVDGGAKKIVLKREGGQLDLAVGPHAVIRDGAKVKSLKDLKPGEKVMVSYVDTGKERTVWYIYSASAAMANPCGGNPCAAVNPCAPKAKKCSANPCAANPCAAKGKQSPKNPCAANP